MNWKAGVLPLLLLGCASCAIGSSPASATHGHTGVNDAPKEESRPRVIVTSDGEIDDECSMVRFLLYANEWDIEGIVTSSSQYHWRGHKWAGDDWMEPYLAAYAAVHPNLLKHDPDFPTPEYLRSRTVLGNVDSEGEMELVTPGSRLIVDALLNEADSRPIWIQAWGGTNTIARALKTIEEEHPDKMASVASKLRLFLIWEQDRTYQDYIRPHWGRFGIPTIISDQFWALAYEWDQILPVEKQDKFDGEWMKRHILQDHGPLAALYKAKEDGSFRSEGDSPAFLHLIETGLRSAENPGWGGWGGRYTRVRENTWLDPVPVPGYVYPEGRWFTQTAWGRSHRRVNDPNDASILTEYFKPIWRWTDALQNDFAARADWSVKPFAEANHAPVVRLFEPQDLVFRRGQTVRLDAGSSTDPDGDDLTYRWWQYPEAGTYRGNVDLRPGGRPQVSAFKVPADALAGQTIHIVAEVTDNGTPPLTRYRRVVVTVAP